ncbi:alpha/beta fold hydrolase [Microlunatus elymi]|uniref:Alpha/beta fold hydrolase n=1 Tax=Microlunatus elymi TaxID=2596828 RepID=A0A516Q448_9ACTN|nr:alpha/beta hydrolase [Microlunatus elymi]QDP98155.1 alpha/beta fold hydrolase [Microlunatus elymi]
MEKTTSADGTVIAYEGSGSGAALVCVSPAFGLRGVFDDLAAEFAAEHTVVRYDRRGRGDSTDAIAPADVASYRIEREVEDLAAVIAAVGGPVAVLGYSSGCHLALAAAAAGLPVDRIALYEPPFRRGDTVIKSELVDKLAGLVAAGRLGDAVATFQIEGVGAPAEMVNDMRRTPMFAALEAVGQTVVYDATLTADPAPSQAVRSLSQPVLAIAGADTWPMLIDGARYVAESVPHGEFIEVPGGANHAMGAVETAAALRPFLS